MITRASRAPPLPSPAWLVTFPFWTSYNALQDKTFTRRDGRAIPDEDGIVESKLCVDTIEIRV